MGDEKMASSPNNEKGGKHDIHLHINIARGPPTNQHDWQNDDSRSKQENNRTHPLDDRRDRTYARPDARTRVATPDAAATIVRGSVLLSSLPAMVPVGSAPPPAIGERLFVLVCNARLLVWLVLRGLSWPRGVADVDFRI